MRKAIGIIGLVLMLWGGLGCVSRDRRETVAVQHINPDDLIRNPAFTQTIAVDGPHRVVYVGGQNAVTAAGEIVGIGDMAVQTAQVYRNLETALRAAGAGLEHMVKCNVYMVQGQPLGPAFSAAQKAWAGRPNPPTISVLYVAGLARPEFLIEIDAVAVVPK